MFKSVPLCNKQWEGSLYQFHSKSRHAKGVRILLDKNFIGTVISFSCDNEGRKFLLNVKCHEEEYAIANVYCPTDQRERRKCLSASIEWINSNKTDGSSLMNGHELCAVVL